MANYLKTESDALSLLPAGTEFYFDNHTYKVLVSGKPRPSIGECKTDLFILAVDENNLTREIKISIKRSSADFIENKISSARAREIFGDDYKQSIVKSISNISKAFENDYLICVDRYVKTNPKSIKLGWKFEIMNTSSGEKSGALELTDIQKINVYSGTTLPDNKKHCRVNGELFRNSGIANMILVANEFPDGVKSIFDNLIPIEEYAIEQQLFFACKAINFRMEKDKWDGNRPLAVYCNWFINGDGLLDVNLIMNNPLEVGGNEVGNNIKRLLSQLNINLDNFSNLTKLVAPHIKIYSCE